MAIGMRDKILMYMHAGSGNHGCEALVNSIAHIIKEPVSVLTNSKSEDEKYSICGLAELIQEEKMEEHLLAHIAYYAFRKLTGKGEGFLAFRYRNAKPFSQYKLAISIGGDNYCYDEYMLHDLKMANRMFHQNGIKTVLLGCSIEPDLLKRTDIIADMNLYDHIIARESITYQALKDAGIRHISLLPDPAFSLGAVELPLPELFLEDQTVGINISPMVMDCEKSEAKGIVKENYEELVRYILENTAYNIALIPHVVWERSDDRKAVQMLYEQFAESKRVFCIPDCSCEELKGYIKRCRFFVGARTHSTIAAYSTCVPTLVAGYSVKSRGIATDLFGTCENYVVSVQDMKEKDELTKAFCWMEQHEEEIRSHLELVMPEYCGRTEKIYDTILM